MGFDNDNKNKLAREYGFARFVLSRSRFLLWFYFQIYFNEVYHALVVK